MHHYDNRGRAYVEYYVNWGIISTCTVIQTTSYQKWIITKFYVFIIQRTIEKKIRSGYPLYNLFLFNSIGRL